MNSTANNSLNAKEDFYRMAILKYKKKEREEKKFDEMRREKEYKNLLKAEENKVNKRKKYSIKKNINKVNDFLGKKADKIPKSNLASQVNDDPVNYSADGGAASMAATVGSMSDYVQEGEEGQAQVDMGKVRKEAVKRTKKAIEAKRKAAQAKKAAKAVEAAKVAKTAKNTKTVLNVGKAIGGLGSFESFGITLLITVIIWIIQIIGAHVLNSKYIPKLAKWEWVCVGVLAACGLALMVMQLMPILLPILLAGGFWSTVASYVTE